jgi:hypothetical protein
MNCATSQSSGLPDYTLRESWNPAQTKPLTAKVAKTTREDRKAFQEVFFANFAV